MRKSPKTTKVFISENFLPYGIISVYLLNILFANKIQLNVHDCMIGWILEVTATEWTRRVLDTRVGFLSFHATKQQTGKKNHRNYHSNVLFHPAHCLWFISVYSKLSTSLSTARFYDGVRDRGNHFLKVVSKFRII